MKSGKVSDTVLRRSILKEVQKVNQGTKLPLVGGGAGAFSLYHVAGGVARAGEDDVTEKQTQESSRSMPELYSAMQTVAGEGLATAYLAVVRAANSLAAKGAVPQYASVAITVPESMEEQELRKLHERYCAYLEQHSIRIVGGHTAASAVVTEPVVSVQLTGMRATESVTGDTDKEVHSAEATVTERRTQETAGKPETFLGLDIVMTKHCGLGGTALLAGRFTDELTKKYPKRFIERGAELLADTEKNEEAYLAAAEGAAYIHAAAEGGVFGALWELAEYAQCGLDIDLSAIPILQETVEICEYFDVNPYQLRTEGVFLILTEHGGRLCEALRERGIQTAVIGRTVPGLDRAVRNGEEVRYLEPNRVEEYERVMAGKRSRG